MATPNDPVPPKKPVPPAGKPVEKPVSQIKPATGKPPIPVGKPAGAPPTGKPAAGTPPTGKPAAGTPPTGKPAGKPPATGAKKPPLQVRGGGAARGGTRKLGQVLVDLGFVDEDQLWGVLEEAKTSGQPTGQAAVARGLITEDQLLQALGDQH